jgi:hypothetical protein
LCAVHTIRRPHARAASSVQPNHHCATRRPPLARVAHCGTKSYTQCTCSTRKPCNRYHSRSSGRARRLRVWDRVGPSR